MSKSSLNGLCGRVAATKMEKTCRTLCGLNGLCGRVAATRSEGESVDFPKSQWPLRPSCCDLFRGVVLLQGSVSMASAGRVAATCRRRPDRRARCLSMASAAESLRPARNPRGLRDCWSQWPLRPNHIHILHQCDRSVWRCLYRLIRQAANRISKNTRAFVLRESCRHGGCRFQRSGFVDGNQHAGPAAGQHQAADKTKPAPCKPRHGICGMRTLIR